ncbi:stage IV sporulation protein A [Anaeromassilibacillus senegalensis]|uniref:stage IV sporulation protein A n=1 Tax=Anaeromassilibacillus senegalensis TaxID=1673717 RepID=UPI0006832AD5|nr:stage IV sporulation protein A [Anaeromassilibacillus senegalensis]
MEERNIYSDISERTNGDIYIGVVGPVRTGKSTFIKRFMDTIVIPNIDGNYKRDRAIDEMPQSAAGRTIMTTEPKFIPEQAVKVQVDGSASFAVRMIDCVGYIVPSALGYVEGDMPRMVMTPWYDEPIPFNMAAEIGTKKVITEHSTIGLVVTTDGSISDIPREEYEEAEERVISELKDINKPFIVLLNCTYPNSEESLSLASAMQKKYEVPVLPVNCMELEEAEIRTILSKILFEFPVKEIRVDMPHWVSSLEKNHWLRSSVYSTIQQAAAKISRIREVEGIIDEVSKCEYVSFAKTSAVALGTGHARITVALQQNLFYKVLGEKTGLAIEDEGALLDCMMKFAEMQKQYDKIKDAYEEVQNTGYGIVMPGIEELSLEEPEIIKQGGKYGIRLKAAAPSIHMMKTRITTEVTPIVGSEQQSQELVMYLLKEFQENPGKIWESNIFGKSLHELVNEGLHNKLYRMPVDARDKVRETIERIINDGCNGLICIIL